MKIKLLVKMHAVLMGVLLLFPGVFQIAVFTSCFESGARGAEWPHLLVVLYFWSAWGAILLCLIMSLLPEKSIRARMALYALCWLLGIFLLFSYIPPLRGKLIQTPRNIPASESPHEAGVQ